MADDWKTDDVEALFDAILQPRDARRDRALLPRPVHAQRAARHGPALGRRPAARRRACTTPRSRARPAPARRRSPGSPRGSTTARAATGRCSTSSTRPRARARRPYPVAGERPMSRRLRLAIPNKGRLVEPTLRLLHDAGLVFEEHDRSLVALVQNYDLDILFVRTNDIIEFVGDGVADLGITGVDLLSETGAELPRVRVARLRPLPARGRGPQRRAVPGDRGPRRPAGRDRPPEHGPPVLRGAAHPGRDHPDLGRRRGRAAARPGRGDRRPRVDRLDARHERPAPDRRRPRVGGGPGRQPGRATATAPAELAAIDTMLSAVIAARGRKYLMMNAPGRQPRRARAAPAGARIADGHPARPRRA